MILAEYYATALKESTANEQDESTALSNLVKLLNSKGHIKLLPRILASLEKIDAREESYRGSVVTVARENDLSKYKKEIEKVLEGREYKVSVDEDIAGGYLIRSDQTIFDKSYKQALLKLYHSVINT